MEPPRIVTLAVAEERGIAFHVVRRRVRSGRWLRLAPGVYCTAPPAEPRDHLLAALAHGGPASVVSGTAALHAYGFRCVREVAGELVLVPATAGARSVGRMQVRRTHRLPDPMWRAGARLAPPPRATVDHARTLGRLSDVRACVAEAVQREFCSAESIWAEVEAGGRNGRALVRRAALEVLGGARSAPEAEAASLLRRAGLGPFEQNARLVVRGVVLYADFLWRDLRAVLEIDSMAHHLRVPDWRRTMERDFLLESAGFSVVHIPPTELRERHEFTQRVAAWLATRRDQLALGERFRAPNAS